MEIGECYCDLNRRHFFYVIYFRLFLSFKTELLPIQKNKAILYTYTQEEFTVSSYQGSLKDITKSCKAAYRNFLKGYTLLENVFQKFYIGTYSMNSNATAIYLVISIFC